MIPVTLYKYQEDSVKDIDLFDGRALLALDMGLGKTVISLEWLRRHPEELPALVICPANVKYNWEHEAYHRLGVRASVCEGKKPPRWESSFDIKPKLMIINYDILKAWIPTLLRMKFRTVIIDECQYLSNPRARRTKASLEAAKRISNAIFLSGTPFTSRPIQMFPILNMLWPDEFPSYWAFAQEYCDPKYTPWGWSYSGASNLDKLHKILLLKGMIRYRKADVLKDLPEQVIRIIPCELSDPDQYQEAKNNFLGWVRKYAPSKAAKVSKAEKLMQVGCLLQLTAKLKMRAVVNWANRFLESTDEKLILFAWHTKAVELLQRRVEGKSVVINGSVTGRLRQAAVDQFRQDSSTRVCIANYIAGGIGLNLQVASEVGLTEMPWTPAAMSQAIGRSHRIGQTKTVFANCLIAPGTIEERVCRVLQERQNALTTVLDGGGDDQGGFDLYEEVVRTLEGQL